MTREAGPKARLQIPAPQPDPPKFNAWELSQLSADDLARLWDAARRVHQARSVDPELRAALLGRLDELEDRDLAERVRAELDEAAPAAVLEAHWPEIVPNRPALGTFAGAFPRRNRVVVPTASEWIADDPERLAGVVAEMARFSSDWRAIADATAKLADQAGIAEDVADAVIVQALRAAREARHA
ncbi:MAG: hypothetical protein ACYCWW_10910 [Deltaproteobacteria bacterium]